MCFVLHRCWTFLTLLSKSYHPMKLNFPCLFRPEEHGVFARPTHHGHCEMFYSHESRFSASGEILRSSAGYNMAKTQLTQTLLHSPYQPPARSGDGLVSCQEGFSIAVTDSSNRLVATLGSRSTLKKVTRKAILEVDVPKACETIQAPSAPMALRLQGNLL
jgi:hypothetical protein